MADRLDISREYYAALESSKAQPSVKLADAICRECGASLADIFKGGNGDEIDMATKEIFERAVMMDEQERKRLLCAAKEIMGGIELQREMNMKL